MEEIKSQTSLKRWLSDRYPVRSVADWARGKSIPLHRHSIWYALGGMLLFMFAMQVVTGVLLAFYYRPTEESAYRSVLNIAGVMPFGWVVRSLHAWTANVMIAVALAHLFSVWFLKSFRKPRELTWVTGILAFGLVLGFGFSGYLLPWDELAFFATKVGTQIVGSVPVVGYRAMTFLRGGEEVSGDTLVRFYAFHVCVLPLIACAVTALHVLLVQVQGVSVPPSVEARKEECRRIPFFPDFLLHDVRVWLVLFGGLLTLCIAVPWGLGEQADPLAPAPAGIRPEWYFLSMYQVLKSLPTRILGIEGEIVGAVCLGLCAVLIAALPFWVGRSDSPRRLSLSSVLALMIVVLFLALTIAGYVSSEREKRLAAATTPAVVVEKGSDVNKAELAGLAVQMQSRIQSDRGPLLAYAAGLWACIGILSFVIHLRLRHSARSRRLGLDA